MKKNIKTILVSFALIGIGIFTTAAVNPNKDYDLHTATKAAAVLTFKTMDISLGEIEQGIPVDITFELLNEGTAPLIIESAKPSCGCTGVEFPQEPINAGDKASISAVYNAKKPGAFTKTITVFSNASEKSHVLKFSGVVK